MQIFGRTILLISVKNQLGASLTITRVGKMFDLIYKAVKPAPKRVTGRLQWLLGPRRGMTLFLFGRRNSVFCTGDPEILS